MIEKIKDIFYDLSDLIVTLIILLVIVFSISFIMNNSLGIDLSKESIFDTLTQKPVTTTPEAVKPETESEPPETSESTPEAVLPVSPTPTESENTPPEEAPQENPPEEARKEYTLTIGNSTTWRKIATNLQANGVISDANAFVIEISKRGLDTKLKAGTYTFKTKSTLEEAIKVLFP